MAHNLDTMDADLLQAELYRLGRKVSLLRKRGLCAHGWSQVRTDGSVECLHCHAIFATEADHYRAYRDALDS